MRSLSRLRGQNASKYNTHKALRGCLYFSLLLLNIRFEGTDDGLVDGIAKVEDGLRISVAPDGTLNQEGLTRLSFFGIADFVEFPGGNIALGHVDGSAGGGVDGVGKGVIDIVESHQCLAEAVIQDALGADRFGAQAVVDRFALGDGRGRPFVCCVVMMMMMMIK